MNLNQKLERAIVVALIDELSKAGYVPVAVWDGGEYVPTKDPQEAMTTDAAIKAVFAVDESTLHFAPKDAIEDWGATGVFLVGGNGEDIISDWHADGGAFDRAVASTIKRTENLTVTA